MDSVIEARSNPVLSLTSGVANAYDLAGDEYLTYADSNTDDKPLFAAKYAYADRHVWTRLDERLIALHESGADEVRILDAGCGPGTWTRRLVRRARELGFTKITARGFDLSAAQIQQAHVAGQSLADEAGIDLQFEVGNLMSDLKESDASVDLTLCLYSVFSHIPVAKMPSIVAELARVTRGHLVTTVRAVGSMPSGIVADIEDVRQFRLDHRQNRYAVELRDGRWSDFYFHLFSSAELAACFAPSFDIEVMEGLDFFHHRFASDHRWNPSNLEFSSSLVRTLGELEQTFRSNPDYIDHANHLLLIGRR